ncbi:MAG: class I SAM-dependent methyltransferase [Thermodesulfovibrio sp.]|nr:class I SAM-dependent methyltransferase [Thermodesulfovibrio sp.]
MNELIYKAERLPKFQNVTYSSYQEAIQCPVGDVELIQDEFNGIVFNRAYEATEKYDKNYNNDQSVSNIFKEHLNWVYRIINPFTKKKRILEIGCGKGYFLEFLLSAGLDAYGVDPAYEGGNSRVIRSYYPCEFNLKFDFIILRHVLEHIPKPLDFLQSIRNLNENALIYIEIPCLEWIVKNKAWFDIYYEHVNYFRISDFRNIFGKVLKEGRFFGGQYIYTIADLNSLKTEPVSNILKFRFPDDFTASVEFYSTKIKEWKKRGMKVVVWGAASKGVIFTLFLHRNSVYVDWVVDINPAKIGRYLPLTGYKVISPAELIKIAPSKTKVLIMNSNYYDEIRSLTDNIFEYVLI